MPGFSAAHLKRSRTGPGDDGADAGAKLLVADPKIHVPGRVLQKMVAIVNPTTPKDHYVQ
jgi:hypothetical protein